VANARSLVKQSQNMISVPAQHPSLRWRKKPIRIGQFVPKNGNASENRDLCLIHRSKGIR